MREGLLLIPVDDLSGVKVVGPTLRGCKLVKSETWAVDLPSSVASVPSDAIATSGRDIDMVVMVSTLKVNDGQDLDGCEAGIETSPWAPCEETLPGATSGAVSEALLSDLLRDVVCEEGSFR